MPVDSAFKQLLLSALEKPQLLSFPTLGEAHKARFQAYNAFKVMKKEGDTFADVKEMLEFIVKQQPNGSATLAIQRKTTNLMQILSGVQVTGEIDNPTPWVAQPPVTTQLQKGLQEAIKITEPKEVDPTSDEGIHLQLLLDIDDWIDHMSSNEKFPLVEAKDLRKKVARKGIPCSTLQAFKDMVQDVAMRKIYKITPSD